MCVCVCVCVSVCVCVCDYRGKDIEVEDKNLFESAAIRVVL